MSGNLTKLHSGIHHEVLRELQGTNSKLSKENLMYPIFIVSEDNDVQAIKSLPAQCRFGINALIEHLKPLVQKGLKSILLFGIVDDIHKDENASYADHKNNPVIRALPILRKTFPNLLLACDVCLCPYTQMGHCGLMNAEMQIVNVPTIKRLGEIATAYALAGAHVVAPSDMMDNRISAIKSALNAAGVANSVSVLSYAAKFASSFYGPFRDAAQSAPSFGDRSTYQLPQNSAGLALRAVQRDIEEGADMVMVKPGLPYLDIVQKVKMQFPNHPLFVYQVSGEYCMLLNGVQHSNLDLSKVLMESMTAFRRAGADCIITYFTPVLLDMLEK